jgi:hypothetical protein
MSLEIGEHRAQVEASDRFDRRLPPPFLTEAGNTSMLVRFEGGGDAGTANGFGDARGVLLNG